MRIITKEEQIRTELTVDDDNYQPLLSIEEQIEGVVLELTRPVEMDGVPTSELTVNSPTPADIIGSESRRQRGKDTDTERSVALFAKACGVAPEVIQSLHIRDYSRLATVVAAFTE